MRSASAAAPSVPPLGAQSGGAWCAPRTLPARGSRSSQAQPGQNRRDSLSRFTRGLTPRRGAWALPKPPGGVRKARGTGGMSFVLGVVVAGRGRAGSRMVVGPGPAVGLAAAVALRHRAPGRPHGGVVQLDGVPHDDVDELGGARAAPRRARRKGAGWPPPRARVGGCATRARDHTSCQGPRPFWARRRTHEAAAQLRHRRPCAQRDRFDGQSGPCNRVRGVTRWPADRTATRQLARVAQAQDAAFSATEGRRRASRQPGVGPEEVETPSRCRSDDKL